MADIFAHKRLSPAQARTVADRRLDDAECLRKTRENARANGVFYLGGLVVECLLKAAVLEKHPHLRSPIDPGHLSQTGRRLQNLVYRLHDLTGLLKMLPEIQLAIKNHDASHGTDHFRQLASICDRWSIFARYSPETEFMRHADEFLDRVRELRRWLK